MYYQLITTQSFDFIQHTLYFDSLLANLCVHILVNLLSLTFISFTFLLFGWVLHLMQRVGASDCQAFIPKTRKWRRSLVSAQEADSSIHSSIFNCLCRTGQSEHRAPDFPLPGHFLQLLSLTDSWFATNNKPIQLFLFQPFCLSIHKKQPAFCDGGTDVTAVCEFS